MHHLPRFFLFITAFAMLWPALPAFAAAVDITADEITRTADGIVVAKGNVVIKRTTDTLRADEVRYRTEQKVLEARGHVIIESPKATIHADHAVMNTNSKTGNIQNATITLPDGARLKAERLKRIDDQRFEAEGVIYSACPVDEESWRIRASSAQLDQEEGTLTTTNSRFEVWQIPVLYTPWSQQPLRRKSGMLMPKIGSGNRRGTEIATPVYLAPHESFDATLTPHWMSARGFMGETELRHASSFGNEFINIAGINDTVTQQLRGRLQGDLIWKLPANITLAAKADHVSDSDYLADYATGDDISSRYLSSEATLSQLINQGNLSGDWSLLLRHQQNMLLQSNARTLHFDPRLESHAQWEADPNLILHFDQQTTRFERRVGTYGWRMDLHPYIEIPWELSGGGISATLQAGSHHTRYWLSQDTAAAQNIRRALTDKMPNRTTAEASLEVRSDFEKISADGKWRHVISPVARFDHIDAPDQSLLPLFDSSFGRLTWGNLLSGNRFSGYDRIERANRFSFLLENSIQRKSSIDDTTLDVLVVRGGMAYDLTRASIDSRIQPAPTRPFSNLLGEIIWKPAKSIKVSTSGQYNTSEKYWGTLSASTTFSPSKVNSISASYRFTDSRYSTESQLITLSAQQRISNRWVANGNWSYDSLLKLSQRTTLGLRYQHPCWAAGAEAYRINRRTGTTQASNLGFRILLEFKGLGSVGS